MTKKPSSFSYKETGVKSVTPEVSNLSPLKSIGQVLSQRNVATLFAKLPALSITDPSLSDDAFRVSALLALPGFGSGEAVCSFSEIASALHRSERSAQRAIAKLVAKKFVEVEKSPNKPNRYRLAAAIYQQDEEKEKPKAKRMNCAKCGDIAFRINKSGHCSICSQDMKIDRAIRELGPAATPEQIALKLSASILRQARRKLAGQSEAAA